MTEFRVTFARPSKLGQDSALALEDYARAVTSRDALVVKDRKGRVLAVQFAASNTPVSTEAAQEVERFFDSLVTESADRLGWN